MTWLFLIALKMPFSLWLNGFDSAERSWYHRRDSSEAGHGDGRTQKNPNYLQSPQGSSVNDKLRFHGRVESAEIREVALLLRFEGPAFSLIHALGLEFFRRYDVGNDVFVGPCDGVTGLDLEFFWLKLEAFDHDVGGFGCGLLAC